MAVHLAGGRGAGLELLSLLQKVFFWRDQLLPRLLHSLTPVPTKSEKLLGTAKCYLSHCLYSDQRNSVETAGDTKTLNYTWGWWRQLMPFIPALGGGGRWWTSEFKANLV